MSTLRFAILSLCTLCLLVACDRPPAYDEEIKALDPELSELPKIRPNLLIPTVGFGSAMGKSAECEAWIDIVLPQPRSFDTIALVPALINDLNGKLGTLGFPRRFMIEAFQEAQASSQHVQLGNRGWIYQSIGKYDPDSMPEQLDYQLEIHQSIGNSVPEAGPATVALYYSKTQGAPALHHDIRDDPHFVLVGEEQTHATWAAQSKATGEHCGFNVSSSISLKDIPRGAELYLRIANHKIRTNVAIDNIQLSAPFQLENNDFELPKLRIAQAKQQVQSWHYSDEIHTNAHCGPYWSTGSLQAPELLVDHTAADFPNPGFAPVLFKVPDGTKAKKVRITATLLQQEVSWRVNQSGHNFAMNEIFLFDGDENVAFNCPSAVSNHSNAPLMFYPLICSRRLQLLPTIGRAKGRQTWDGDHRSKSLPQRNRLRSRFDQEL